MTDLRLTFIDLWWPQNLAFQNLCMMYIKRKLSTQGYHLWKHFFSALYHMTSHDHDLTSCDLFGPWKLKNWKSTEYRHVAYQLKAKDSSITMKTCSDKWEVKWLTSGWPKLTFDDLKLCVLEHMHDVFKKCWPPKDIIWDKPFAVHMTSHDPELTSKWKLKTAVLWRKYVQASLR